MESGEDFATTCEALFGRERAAGKAVTNSSSPAGFLSFVTVFIELIPTTATMKTVEPARLFEVCAAEDMRLAPLGTGS
jgi:hypothetical protein